MRAIWSGGISFGLIYIPVKLYSGSQQHNLNLDMVRESDGCPIKYVRVCKKDGKEVSWDEIAKGYEYEDGDYVILKDEDFDKVNVEKTSTIDIQAFINEDEVDSKYFEKPYYLEPDKKSEKTYVLLREALKKTKKAGIAKFVLRNREHLGLLKPSGDLIILNQMRFKDEIRDEDKLDLPENTRVGKEELEMAMKLIDQLTTEFNPGKYKDTYNDELRKLIEDKAKGKKPKPKAKERKKPDMDNLLDQLKESLETVKA